MKFYSILLAVQVERQLPLLPVVTDYFFEDSVGLWSVDRGLVGDQPTTPHSHSDSLASVDEFCQCGVSVVRVWRTYTQLTPLSNISFAVRSLVFRSPHKVPSPNTLSIYFIRIHPGVEGQSLINVHGSTYTEPKCTLLRSQEKSDARWVHGIQNSPAYSSLFWSCFKLQIRCSLKRNGECAQSEQYCVHRGRCLRL
jgi:hypothetical protein